MPYKKKAPAKRTKKAVGGNLSASHLSAAQKKLLGNTQAGAVKKGAGAITNKIVGMTRKYGDQRKAAAAPTKRKAPTSRTGRILKQMTPAQVRALRARGQTAKPKKGGIAMSPAARANLMRMQREAFRTGKSNPKLAALTKKHGMLVKRGDAQKQMQSQVNKRRAGGKTPRIMSTVTGARKARELAAKRRGSSTTSRPTTGNRSRAARAAQGSAARKLVLARRRAAIRKQAAAAFAARKRRAAARNRRAAVGRNAAAPSKRQAFRSSQAAQRRARALAARRRAAAASRRNRTSRPAVGSTPRTFSRMTPAQLAAARKRAAAAGRRRAAAIAARKRRAPTRRAPTRKAPTRRAPTRRAPTRRAPTRRPVRRMRRR